MSTRSILLGILVFLFLAIIAGLYLWTKAISPVPETAIQEAIIQEAEKYIKLGYAHSPGALPITYQLEELRKKTESGDYLLASGKSLGATRIASKNQAFNIAKNELHIEQIESPGNIETVLSCYTEKENGVEVFLILAVKK